MTTTKNPLNEPDAYGLDVMAEYDIGGFGEYDMVAVWRHRMTGIWYIATDTGCCCPTPFDNVTGEDLTAVFTLDGVSEFARKAWADTPEPRRSEAVEALSSLVRESWLKAGAR